MARAASSTETPRTARSAICSWYAEPLEIAFAKIVGLDVTPCTCRSRTSPSRLPVDRRSLLMSSSQIATPAAVSWASVSSGREFMAFAPCPLCYSSPSRAGARLRGCAHVLSRQSEFGVQGPVVRRFPLPVGSILPGKQFRARRRGPPLVIGLAAHGDFRLLLAQNDMTPTLSRHHRAPPRPPVKHR